MIPAAVAVVLREGGDGLETLFIHRAERAGDTWSGQIAFPGGRKESADADLRATAIRETREEIGVDLATAELLAVLDDMYPRTPVLPPVVVRPFVFALPDRVPLPTLALSAEVQDAFWVSFRVLAAHHRGASRAFPAYVVGQHTIWGMTERILTPLLTIVSQSQS
jgi:8-oxo-dGTP pyrophosphatase MutT (NUDIX family)